MKGSDIRIRPGARLAVVGALVLVLIAALPVSALSKMVRDGLSVRYPHHDDHIHLRVCEAGHAKSRYRC